MSAPNRELDILGVYFTSLATFSHDKARETAEKERECLCRGSSSSAWAHLIPPLIQLAGVEKQYLNAAFLQQRGFLRRDGSPKNLYESIHNEMQRVGCRIVDLGMDVDSLGELATKVARDVAMLAKGRLQLMEVYEKLCGSFPKPPPYREVIGTVKAVGEMAKNATSEGAAPWVAVFQLEVGVLHDYLMSATHMQVWKFFESLILLQSGSDQLAKWTEIIQTRETKKMSFASSFGFSLGGTAEPHVYLWFYKLKAMLLSKFSLYFHLTLSGQTSSTEMRAHTAKLAVDQQARISAFHRKVDAQSVSVVFDATGLDPYTGPGYHHPDNTQASNSGLELYPSVFSHPTQPKDHWPSIVMLLNGHATELADDKPVYLYDSGVGATYFFNMIEPRFTLVLVFDGKRAERESAINLFLQEIIPQLRCSKVYASLKPGTK